MPDKADLIPGFDRNPPLFGRPLGKRARLRAENKRLRAQCHDLRDRVQAALAECDYAEAHARHIVGDNAMVDTGLIRFALNSSPPVTTGEVAP